MELAASQPLNPLWQGRGQPGTHDVELGAQILAALRDGTHNVELPRFDKSLFGGQGDRLPMDGSGFVIEQPPPVDVVILEGWCMGFHPITQLELDQRWAGVWKEEQDRLGLSGDTLCSKRDIERVNEVLVEYGQLWGFFDTFIQVGDTINQHHLLIQPVLIKITPFPSNLKGSSSSIYSIVYQWRLEQEQYMKAENGGRGMTDEAVKGLVLVFP
jgi:D-glycerate 3-kinase